MFGQTFGIRVVSAVNIFKLQEKNTNFLAEMIAGMTTFVTMSYLLVQCPKLLAEGGVSEASAYLAICIASGISCIALGILSNQPFALAPSVGMTVFFSSTLVSEMGYSYAQALAITLMGSMIFLLLSLAGLQNALYGAIPKSVKNGVSAGLGIYIALIGLKNAGLFGSVSKGLWKLPDFSEFNETVFSVIVMVSGVLLTVLFKKFRIPVPVLLGIFSSGMIYYVLGVRKGYASPIDLSADTSGASDKLAKWAAESLAKDVTHGLAGVFKDFKFDLKTVFMLLLVVLVCAIFNSVESTGVIYATARNGGMLDGDGNFGDLKNTMFANAISSMVSSLCGAPMMTVAAESGAGMLVGGKTGLTAVTTGVFFLLAALFTPFVEIIPPVVTACAMVLLGMSMVSGAKDIDFGEYTEGLPAFVTIMIITFTSSVLDGIAIGIITHIATSLVSVKFKSLKLMEVALCALMVAAYYFI